MVTMLHFEAMIHVEELVPEGPELADKRKT